MEQSKATYPKSLITDNLLQSLVFASMKDGVSVSDQDGYILITNAAEDEMFGYEPGELIGKHVTTQNAYTPEENKKIVNAVMAALQQHGVWTGEWHNRKKDGTEFFTQSSISSYTIEETTLFVCVQRDITQEKVDKEKHAYRTALLEAQNEAIPDGILTVDTKGKIISYNNHFVTIWNIPQEIIDNKDDDAALRFAMTQLTDPQGFIDRVSYCYEHPDEKAHEEIIFKDGRIIERYGNAVTGADGKMYGWAWYFRDVTERKKIEQDLENTKNQLELTFNNIPAGVYLFNDKGELIYVNEKGAGVYGDFSPAELLAESNLSALLQKANELFERYDEQGNPFGPQNSPAYISLKTGRSSQTILRQINRLTGEEQWHYVQGAPLFNQEEKLSMVLVTSTDITIQKLAEAKIRESEERFRSLANSIPQLAWMTDSTGYIYWYNQRWYDYTGTTFEEMKGWGWQSVHHPDLVEKIKKDFADAVAKGVSYDDTFLLKSKEGTYRWFLTRAVPIRNAEGEIVQWFGTNTDVSEQRETEETLKRTKEQLEVTFKNVPSAIFHFDKKGNILYLNEQCAHQLGYSSVEEVLAEKDLTHLVQHLYKSFDILDESGKPLPYDKSCTAITFATGKSAGEVAQLINRTTGKSLWLLSQASPLFDENGQLAIVLTTSTDISQQKTSEQSIRQSEEQFRTLAETLPQLVWITDEKGNQLYASSRWKFYTGIDPDGAESWQKMVHPADLENISNAWIKSMQSGNNYQSEARLKNKAGVYRWHFVHGEPIRNEAGNIIKWIGAFTDVHDQKTLSENLEKLVAERTKELERSNEDLLQFAHVASHDLKEPVRKIKMFGSRLEEEFKNELPEKAKSYITKMLNAADRIFTMIDGVLVYSSFDAMEIHYEEVDLNEIFKNIETDLEIIIQQKQATIVYDTLPVIEGLPILLHQLFYNLINNSLKFSKTEVRPLIQITSEFVSAFDLHIDGSPDRQYVRLRICDNGIGFDQSHVTKIFKTFLRLNSKDKYEGTGLGLALCKKIAERHEGYIEAEGIEGKGSVFTVVLPVKAIKPG